MIHSLMMLSAGAKWDIIERKQRFRIGLHINIHFQRVGFDSGSF